MMLRCRGRWTPRPGGLAWLSLVGFDSDGRLWIEHGEAVSHRKLGAAMRSELAVLDENLAPCEVALPKELRKRRALSWGRPERRVGTLALSEDGRQVVGVGERGIEVFDTQLRPLWRAGLPGTPNFASWVGESIWHSTHPEPGLTVTGPDGSVGKARGEWVLADLGELGSLTATWGGRSRDGDVRISRIDGTATAWTWGIGAPGLPGTYGAHGLEPYSGGLERYPTQICPDGVLNPVVASNVGGWVLLHRRGLESTGYVVDAWTLGVLGTIDLSWLGRDLCCGVSSPDGRRLALCPKIYSVFDYAGWASEVEVWDVERT